jgi:hypothetical protein
MESKVSSLSDGRSDEYLLPHRSPSPSALRAGFRWSIRGRRILFATCACLAAASLFGLLTMMLWSSQSKSQIPLDQEGQQSEISKPTVDEWSPLSVLRGPATESLWGGSKCASSNQLQSNAFWQITCAMIQSTSHHGLRLVGVRNSVCFDDTLEDLFRSESSQRMMS